MEKLTEVKVVESLTPFAVAAMTMAKYGVDNRAISGKNVGWKETPPMRATNNDGSSFRMFLNQAPQKTEVQFLGTVFDVLTTPSETFYVFQLKEEGVFDERGNKVDEKTELEVNRLLKDYFCGLSILEQKSGV